MAPNKCSAHPGLGMWPTEGGASASEAAGQPAQAVGAAYEAIGLCPATRGMLPGAQHVLSQAWNMKQMVWILPWRDAGLRGCQQQRFSRPWEQRAAGTETLLLPHRSAGVCVWGELAGRSWGYAAGCGWIRAALAATRALATTSKSSCKWFLWRAACRIPTGEHYSVQTHRVNSWAVLGGFPPSFDFFLSLQIWIWILLGFYAGNIGVFWY